MGKGSRTPALGRHLAATGAAAIIVAVTLVGVGPGASASGRGPSKARLVAIDIPAPDNEIATQWLSYPGPPRANVLLPAGYNRHQRYPLVVFLHGLNTDYAWIATSGLAKQFDHLGAIVVMPEGAGGWYTDWWNGGERASPSWESYELETMLPTVLARYPVLPQRRYHALVGISMGGLGATYLGGRLPDFFGSVATLSGFVDTGLDADGLNPSKVQSEMATYSNAAAHGDTDPDPIYGPPEGFYADGHDPTLLVRNLEHTRVFESTGTGVPSKADPNPGVTKIKEEHLIYTMSKRYHSALVAAGIDVTYQVHRGVHDQPNFRGEVKAMLRWGLFKPVATEPASWDNQTVATSGQLWDVNYRFAMPPTRLVTFRQSGTALSISGAGSTVTITTGTGCTIRTPTPATLHLPSRDVIAPVRPEQVGRRACG